MSLLSDLLTARKAEYLPVSLTGDVLVYNSQKPIKFTTNSQVVEHAACT